ncbi:MAG: Lrp/AsnC family transcriptional regulator, partial [Rhodospirillales bacterium]|nr:Lrp/AsnC family transcriptional regulator [Rhodospirillales bacterium]
MHGSFTLDATDRRLIEATQSGLPLCAEPYQAVADALDLPVDEVMSRMDRMQSGGIIRRIGAIPNHYALGYHANGMSVWDVDDSQLSDMGRAVGALEFVSHCYRRPRRRPDWRYNLFAMVHGRNRGEVEAKVDQVRQLLGDSCRDHQILY